jgi:hypothetical protein
VQFIDGKSAVLDGWQQTGETNILHVSFGVKLQSRESQSNAAFYGAAERAGIEVRDYQAVVIDGEGAMTGEAFGVKVIIRKRDIAACVYACAMELAAGKCSFAVNVGATGGDQGVAQYFAKIDELEPAAVAKVPSRVGKADEPGLRIDMGAAGCHVTLMQGETVARNCELRGNANGNWEKTPSGECNVLPVKIAVVVRMIKWAAGIQREMQIVSFDGQRSSYIVIEQPAVLELEVLDVQVEDCFCEGFCGTGAARFRKIGDAVFCNSDVHMRLVNDQTIQGNFVAPPGIDAYTSLYLVGGEERLGAGGL